MGKPGKNRGPLSYDQLLHLGEHAMTNAESLIKEARFLLDGGFHARAGGLAILALEEAGKAFMCGQWAGRKPIPRKKEAWQPFWDHFTYHVPKYVRALHYEWPRHLEWNQDSLKQLESIAKDHGRYREWCFYVGFDGQHVNPPQAIDRDACVQFVESAEALLDDILGARRSE